MFEKLLSVLPYNPGLVHQMAFYSRRMREETAIRRTGMVFIVLAFMIQFFAVLNPPQPTSAGSSNDLVSGGFSTPKEAEHNCLNNIRHYKDILSFYGITDCRMVGTAETLTLHSNAEDGQYYSMGWNPQGARNNSTGKPTNETPVNVSGAGTLYWRKLNSWDTVPGNGLAYKALKLHNNAGKTFYILYTCGNLVTIGVPTPTLVGVFVPTPTPPPPPKPTPPPTTPPKTPVCPYNSSLPANSPLCFKPCQYNSLLPATDVNCKPCDKSVNSSDSVACVSVHKTASNITGGIANADGTTANPGDVITYTLYATNQGKADVKQFIFQENLNDVLDYADATDLHGGKIDAEHNVTWPAQTIKAGATVKHQITVKVKNPVPQTPTSVSDPMHFDLTMTNVYGNAVNIKVPGSPTKTIEGTASSLPNTGPGSSLFIGGLIVIITGYFFARARLLAEESGIAVQESNSGGLA